VLAMTTLVARTSETARGKDQRRGWRTQEWTIGYAASVLISETQFVMPPPKT
jgi:hypothetical protein